jgi:hypothetical protein
MMRTGHHGFISGRLHRLGNSRIISRDNCARNIPSSERALYNPANHRLSGDFEQGFTRQTNRIVASRDYCDSVCFWIRRRI